MLKRITAIPLTAIVLLSLALKLVFFCYISPWDKKAETEKVVVSDSWGYEKMAENLLKFHSCSIPEDTFHIANYSDYRLTGFLTIHLDSYRMPLYPSFMAAIYFVTGVKPYAVILAQILLSLFSVVFVFLICMLLFKQVEIAKIASLLFALDIHSAFVANQVLTDTLFIVLFLASVFLFIKGLLSSNIILILFSGIFMGLGVLTRAVILFYPAIFVLAIFAFSKQKTMWKLKALFCFLLPFSCLALTWSLRNEARFGHFQYSTQGGDELLMYNAAFTESLIKHKNIDSVRIQFQKKADSLGFRSEKDVFKQSDIYTKIAVEYIKKNKAFYIKTHLLGAVNMFLAIGNAGMAKMLGWDKAKHEEAFAEINTGRIMQNFTNNKKETLLGLVILLILAIQYLGAVLGLFYLWKNKQSQWLSGLFILLFLFTAIYFAGLAGVVGTYRYKLAIVPFICMAAGYGYFTRTSTLPK